jgi:PAP2 superfamily
MQPTSRTNIAALSMVVAALFGAPAHGDVIMDWNTKADAIAAVKPSLTTPMHARGTAILHLAMFEAVNAIERRYSSYKLELVAERGASKEAAAAAAGHDALLSLHPDQKADLEAALTKMLAAIPEGAAKTSGIALGKKAAAGIIALRANDGSEVAESYRPHGSPGVYVPTVVPRDSMVGGYTPWTMTRGSQFRPEPPPALDSETWTRDLNEIRELGALNSKTRTAEQTEIGRFWFLTGARSYNPVVHQVAKAKDMDIVDCARLFALVSMAGSDAYIAVFDAKYTYNFWRPITAVRYADPTRNNATPRDAGWVPLGDTPMHPEYPCAHCITSAAVSTVMQGLVGEQVSEISLISASVPGVTRQWTRLRDYNEEVANARIYAGFHYRFSTEVGKDMGRKVGELTLTQLRPVVPVTP